MQHLRISLVAILAAIAFSGALAEDEPKPDIGRLIADLGADPYPTREAAQSKLLAVGPAVRGQLEASLEKQTDPEICRRLQYILENIDPPRHGALVVRCDDGSGLFPGDIITHVNGRRVSGVGEVRQRMRGETAPLGALLRVRGPEGPREVGPVHFSQIDSMLDYRAARGEEIAEIVRLYNNGYVEQAYERIRAFKGEPAEEEFSRFLKARIAYAAGDATTAFTLLGSGEEAINIARSGRAEWESPTALDLAGPGRAPLHIEWQLRSDPKKPNFQSASERDLRVQRILAPAQRISDAFLRAAQIWHDEYRDALGEDEDINRMAGNQLAVCGWMLSDLGLRSECCRVIEPRSRILRSAPQGGIRKWVRVETDAWTPYFAGDAKGALDMFYDDAMDVLHRPPRPGESNVLIRNPYVAARIAFFLYQVPGDKRSDEALSVIGHHAHPLLNAYVDWMLFSLNETNQEQIRRHLQMLLPKMPDEAALPCARAVALLEYMQAKPDMEAMQAARQRIAAGPPGTERDTWTQAVDALIALSNGKLDEASQTLADCAEPYAVRTLRETAAFLASHADAVASHAALREARLIVSTGSSGKTWIALGRDRRLLLYNAETNTITAINKPLTTWFPGPINWPWINHDESGATWVYSRNRVIEIAMDDAAPLKLNINWQDIAAFDHYVTPLFSRFAELVRATPLLPGEDGEFLRRELLANVDYTIDPDLPEIAFIEPLSSDPRVVHVACRGGASMLVNWTTGKSVTSIELGKALNLSKPPTFFSQAVIENEKSAPVVILFTDQGLARYDFGDGVASLIPIPGDTPYPPLIPESAPYNRRDPRYVYCARLPEDGGQVYRLNVADFDVETVDMLNVTLPTHFYNLRRRSDIRAELDRRMNDLNLPKLEEFVQDVDHVVDAWSNALNQPQ